MFANNQEEVEQAELEQAIAMSLALEAKRVEHKTLQEDDDLCNTKGAVRGRRGDGGGQAGAALAGSEASLERRRVCIRKIASTLLLSPVRCTPGIGVARYSWIAVIFVVPDELRRSRLQQVNQTSFLVLFR